jgi:hypothetical protein
MTWPVSEQPMVSRVGTACLLFATLVCVRGMGQSSPTASGSKAPADDPSSGRLVDQLVENAASFRATLPSITAHETIESDSSDGWLFRRHATAEATMRVTRKTYGGPLQEDRQITVLDGKPVPRDKHIELPTALSGGFGNLAEVFFTSANRHCFNYSLIPKESLDATLELRITLRPDATSFSNCPKGRVSAVALISAEDHQLTHLEWNIPNEDAVQIHHWPFASVDLAPIALGDRTFWLPTTVIGRSVIGNARANWVSHYSDYQRFTATSTVLPAVPQ